MSPTHDIDNEGNLFHFDSCEEAVMPSFSSTIASSANTVEDHSRAMSSHDGPSTSEGLSGGEEGLHSAAWKGKGVTKSMPIGIPVAVAHDLFDISPPGHMAPTTSRNSHHSIPSHPLTSSPLKNSSLYNNGHHIVSQLQQGYEEDFTHPDSALDSWKGKGKELPPTLPPLAFSPTESGYEHTAWSTSMTPIQGPSSYSTFGLSTTCSSTNTTEGNNSYLEVSSIPQVLYPDLSTPEIPLLKRMPSRRRSLSNLSVHSTRSLAARSMSRIKLKLGSNHPSSNLTRIFLFSKTTEEPPKVLDEPGLVHDGGFVSSAATRHTTPKVDDLDSSAPQLPYHNIHDITSQHSDAFYYKANPLKHKGRSHSSPFPISALDYVPVISKDIFTPIPLVIRNYFDEVLPEELRLQVLASLIDLHEAEFVRAVEDGRWTMAKASSSKGRWIGRNKGVRELVRLSRVSTQLLKLSPPPNIYIYAGIQSLAETGLRWTALG